MDTTLYKEESFALMKKAKTDPFNFPYLSTVHND